MYFKDISCSSKYSIAAKELFCPAKTLRTIDELGLLLRQEHFSDIQKRLSDSGMRTGFVCLFSGGSGTGKTETAYQIARKSGRDIMNIDISTVKSKWMGESEKRIKAIFDKYRTCIGKCETAPILLFNEADGVLGKRRIFSDYNNGPVKGDDAALWYWLRKSYAHARLPKQAVAACSRAIELDPVVESYMTRAWAYQQLKQWVMPTDGFD